MTLRSILHYPDNRLRQHCPEHTSFDDSLKELVSDMFQTMYHEKGIGLSAIQINVITRVITIDVSKEQNQKLVLINPVILEMSEPILFDEGCLSVPGFYEQVERFNRIKYEAKDINGNKFNSEASELSSRVANCPLFKKLCWVSVSYCCLAFGRWFVSNSANLALVSFNVGKEMATKMS